MQGLGFGLFLGFRVLGALGVSALRAIKFWGLNPKPYKP